MSFIISSGLECPKTINKKFTFFCFVHWTFVEFLLRTAWRGFCYFIFSFKKAFFSSLSLWALASFDILGISNNIEWLFVFLLTFFSILSLELTFKKIALIVNQFQTIFLEFMSTKVFHCNWFEVFWMNYCFMDCSKPQVINFKSIFFNFWGNSWGKFWENSRENLPARKTTTIIDNFSSWEYFSLDYFSWIGKCEKCFEYYHKITRKTDETHWAEEKTEGFVFINSNFFLFQMDLRLENISWINLNFRWR